MSSIKITIGLVLFGGVKYLPYSLASLLDQDYPHIEYLILDQEEGTYSATKWVERERPEWLAKASFWDGPNLMHSGGHNKLMSKMSGDIYIVVSQDMLYPKDFVSKVANFFEQHSEFDFATARLMRWDFENLEKTNKIDSLGLKINTFHQSYEIGQGQEALSPDIDFEEIFGASGALLAIRKSALKKINVNGQFFDESLHYKNDVDLAYRLQWAVCRGALINDLIVYHDRLIGAGTKKPFWVKKQSLFGDWFFILKNYSWQYSLLTHWKTWAYLFAKTAYLILTSPKLFGVIGDLRKKRKVVVDWREKMPRNISARQMENKLK